MLSTRSTLSWAFGLWFVAMSTSLPAQDVSDAVRRSLLEVLEGFHFGAPDSEAPLRLEAPDPAPDAGWMADLVSDNPAASLPAPWRAVDPVDAPWLPVDGTALPLTLALQTSGGGGGAEVDDETDLYYYIEDGEKPPKSSSSKRRKKPRQTQFSGTFNFVGYPWTDFKVGDLKSSWDDSWRWELEAMGHLPLVRQAEPLAGMYFFYENRDWKRDNASIDYDVWGFGGEIAVLLYPLSDAAERPLNLSLMPFFRVGVGFNDGSFQNIPVQGGFSTGSTGDTRLELSVGAEARLTLFRRVSVGLGGGFTYWESFSVSGRVVNGGGVIIIRDADIPFRGKDGFLRLSISILF